MDVINLSLGGDSGWEEDPGSVFADKLVGLGKSGKQKLPKYY